MKCKKQTIELNMINDARIILFGIAACLVVFFHTYNLNYMKLINVPILSELMSFIQKTGNVGVDIFVFLSSIGLYLSLTKNSVFKFYKNRFIKIIPKYLIVLIIYSFFVADMGVVRIIETLLGFPFFFEGVRDGWYIAFIMPMYLIFPLIYKIIKKYDMYSLLVGLLIWMIVHFTLSFVNPADYFKWEVAFARVPIFLVGTFVGKKIYEGIKISLKTIKACFVIQLIILLIIYLNIDLVNLTFFARYFYCPLTVCFVINISWLYSLLKNKDQWWLKPLKFIGRHSLEIYLISEKCSDILRTKFMLKSYVDIYLLSFIITLVLSFVLKKVVDFLINKISMLFKKLRVY